PWLHPKLIAPTVFLVACFVAFSTGTSFGTMAIMIPLAVPLAAAYIDAGAIISMPLVVSAVLGGAVFGDHCSPISDTTIVSSMAAASDHIDHVRTQMPYALVVGGITTLLYLVIGMSA
ncbi:MAG TPA: Na+/H+ antiporter NhaC family protein, partial [Opitutales bacterium]|nr:Na+/H+ antiporter NhaC family protein [Opitutales bacterium]